MSNKGNPVEILIAMGLSLTIKLIIVLVKLKIGKPNYWLYRYYLAQSQPALHGQAEYSCVYHRALVVYR